MVLENGIDTYEMIRDRTGNRVDVRSNVGNRRVFWILIKKELVTLILVRNPIEILTICLNPEKTVHEMVVENGINDYEMIKDVAGMVDVHLVVGNRRIFWIIFRRDSTRRDQC